MKYKDLSQEAVTSIKEGKDAEFVSKVAKILDLKSQEIVSSYLNEETDMEIEEAHEITEEDILEGAVEITLDFDDDGSLTITEDTIEKISAVYIALTENNKKTFLADLNSTSRKLVEKLVSFCEKPINEDK